MEWNKDKIEELAQIITQYDLTEAEITDGDKKIVLKKTSQTVQASTIYPPMAGIVPTTVGMPKSKSTVDFKRITEVKALQDELQSTKKTSIDKEKNEKVSTRSNKSISGEKQITSPIAGIFYRQSQPGNPPYVEIGQHIIKGEVVCLVEAMKMINEIASTCDGVVKEILVENEQFVEYGTPLVIIEEDY